MNFDRKSLAKKQRNKKGLPPSPKRAQNVAPIDGVGCENYYFSTRKNFLASLILISELIM